ncbi:hypothetical protein CYMTET_7109 [Cymbomonas tetramitiformis]|uniref:Nucleoporin p58/p45 n=1 Tax=Cymbomonas tetramitiformis TaxID=36881 RepID=A0AAE0LHT3_9CHLO|nr:hypothetical protein CYMTET_7109 [Cymbomonas tetramitiformis]
MQFGTLGAATAPAAGLFATQAAPQSQMFGTQPFGAATAPAFPGTSFAGPQFAGTQPQGGLTTKTGQPITYQTVWEELSPGAQTELVRRENEYREHKIISERLSHELEKMDAAETRSGLGYGPESRTEEEARLLGASLRGLASMYDADKKHLESFSEAVKVMLSDTDTAYTILFNQVKARDTHRLCASLPDQYLKKTMLSLEELMGKYKQYAQELEGVVSSVDHSNHSAQLSPAALPQIMMNLHEYFLDIAAKVEAVHRRVGERKEGFLNAQRRLGDMTDPFLEADKWEEAQRVAAAQRQANEQQRKQLEQQRLTPAAMHGVPGTTGMAAGATAAAAGGFPGMPGAASPFNNFAAGTTFGAGAAATTPGFGAAPLAPAFGAAPVAAPAFGAAAAPAFGGAAGGLFGAAAAPAFGAAPAAAPAFGAAAAPAGAFGGGSGTSVRGCTSVWGGGGTSRSVRGCGGTSVWGGGGTSSRSVRGGGSTSVWGGPSFRSRTRSSAGVWGGPCFRSSSGSATCGATQNKIKRRLLDYFLVKNSVSKKKGGSVAEDAEDVQRRRGEVAEIVEAAIAADRERTSEEDR